VHTHPDVRVLLLRANGRHFSAGADLREFGTADFPLEARRIRWDRDPWTPLWDLPVPSIVALHGYAVGAGIEMAMLCDLRFAARDTVVGLPEVTLGMLPAAGGTQSLARVIGPDRALPFVLLGTNIDATEALRRGIVHEVVDDVETRAREIARYLAGLDRATLVPAVRALRAAIDGHGRL
jgi:enoyl-CoA hydratase/carnithine racemase